jgi:hypothetical protein
VVPGVFRAPGLWQSDDEDDESAVRFMRGEYLQKVARNRPRRHRPGTVAPVARGIHDHGVASGHD